MQSLTYLGETSTVSVNLSPRFYIRSNHFYLWVTLKFLSPHSPSLVYSIPSKPGSVRGKLLIMLNERLKRLLRVKGTLISRDRKSSQPSNSIKGLSSEKELLPLLSRERGVVTGSPLSSAETPLQGDLMSI